MKFLCDACKTKYQIDDDKVAGKTVRMKCRKCDHLIEIRQAAAAPSSAPPRRTPTVPPPPASSAKGPLRAPAKPAGPPRKPAPTRPLMAGNTGAFRALQNPLNPSTQTLARQAPRPGVAPLQARGALAGRPSGAAPVSLIAEESDQATQVQESPSLQSALGAGSAALDALGTTPPPPQWFVAIDGSPVGPISEADVRGHVGNGKINVDSLAWREGLGDWRRAADVPELAHLFVPAKARNGQPVSGIQARTPMPSVDLEPRAATNSVPDDVVRGARAAIDAQHLTHNPFAPSNGMNGAVNPFAPSNGAAVDPFAPAPLVQPNPFGVAEAASASGVLAPAAFDGLAEHPASAPVQDSAPLGLASAGPAGPSLEAPVLGAQEQKKPVPWIPIAMVLGAVAFAITAAIVLFLPKPTVQVAEEPKVTPPAAASSAAVASDDIPPPDPSAATTEPPDTKVGQGTARTSSGGSKAAPAASNPNGAADLSRLGLGGGSANGPSGSGGGSAGGGTGSLSQSQIEGTVRNYMPGVKKGCWDTSSAQSGDVRATITIGASGSVQNVSSQSGDPALARCIETKVRGWKFPPPGGTQTVTVPFKFVRQ